MVLQGQAGKIDDLFQLEGMNGLGLAGAEIHGVIGYSVLAQYRIEYDFTQPKLSWTKLDYRPPAVGGIGGRSAPAGLDMLGGLMKFMGAMMGLRPNFAVQPRGFLGAEFVDGDDGVSIKTVLKGSPAAVAGLRSGDVIRKIGDSSIGSFADVSRRLASQAEGSTVKLTISRKGEARTMSVELGRGL